MISNAMNTLGSGSPNIYNYGKKPAAPLNYSPYPKPQTMPEVKPTGVIKRTSTTNPDGSKTEIHYDNTPQQGVKGMLGGGSGPDIYNYGQKQTPAASMVSKPNASMVPTGTNKGMIGSGSTATSSSTPSIPTQVESSTTPATTPGFIGDNGTQKSYASGVIDSSQTQPTPSRFSGYVGSLADSTNNNQTIADKAAGIADKAAQDYTDVGRQGARAQAGYLTTGTSPVAEGNAAVIANTTANQQKAISEGANLGLLGTSQALSAQGQKQSGLGTAAGLIAPQSGAAFFGSPDTGGLVGSGNALLDNAVSQAVKLVQAGTPVNDPSVSSLLSPFGALGTQAFTGAMQNGGAYNPALQSATSGQNISQSVDYQKQSTDLDTSLKQLDTASTVATNFLNSEKLLNPTDNPHYNAGINTYVGEFKNPAARLQYNTILGDISKFTSTILSSNNGQIPTAVTQQLQSFDPSTLSAPQLVPYLQTLRQLGGNQLSILQSQSSASGNSGASGYKGTPTGIDTTPTQAPTETSTGGSKVDNPYLQAGIGTLMNSVGGIFGTIKGLASHLFGSL